MPLSCRCCCLDTFHSILVNCSQFKVATAQVSVLFSCFFVFAALLNRFLYYGFVVLGGFDWIWCLSTWNRFRPVVSFELNASAVLFACKT